MSNRVKLEHLNRWDRVAEYMGIPEKAGLPEIKVVKDSSKMSCYKFVVMFNDYRTGYRPNLLAKDGCSLCGAVELAVQNKKRQLFPDSDPIPGYIGVPNIFPTMRGASLMISKEHKPIHTTRNLDGLAEKLNAFFKFGDETGFRIHYNTAGAGASIPEHEHFHLMNFFDFYNRVGRDGMETAKMEGIRGTKLMRVSPVNYPFVHAVFDQDDPERIVYFLKQLKKNVGVEPLNDERVPEGVVPHWICQLIRPGILVVPAKTYARKGIGSGEPIGYMGTGSREEFERATNEKEGYKYCVDKLRKRFFTWDEFPMPTFD